jgi:hypothetical protein
LIQSKESFRAAYLGAGGSLAMVELEREVGGGQDERGADVYGRGRGGSSRMKHRSRGGRWQLRTAAHEQATAELGREQHHS